MLPDVIDDYQKDFVSHHLEIKNILDGAFSWIDRIVLDEGWLCMELSKKETFYHKPFNTFFKKNEYWKYTKPANRVNPTR